MICSILASTSQGGIGNQGTLPWPKNSEDLHQFKKHTENQIVVMGRNTWDDPMMPNPLPNRVNFVVTNRKLNVIQARTINGDISQEVTEIKERFPDKKVFVIGGKSIYEATQNIVERVYLTRIKGAWFSDTRIDLEQYLLDFRLYSVRPGHNCTYETWNRISFN
jgi:dihydrofolate reductase